MARSNKNSSAESLDDLFDSDDVDYQSASWAGDVLDADSMSTLEAAEMGLFEPLSIVDPELEVELGCDKSPAFMIPPGSPQGARKRTRTKKSEIINLPPIDPNGPPVSVYQRLSDYGLLKKITDIVLAKVSVPWHLREDATQEVHATWASLVTKPEFERNQVARYAYMSGEHAALKLRRTLGAVVVIPGALFRPGNKSSFLSSIGAAVNPKNIDEFDDLSDLAINAEMPADYHVPERFLAARLAQIDATDEQKKIAHLSLVDRLDSEAIARQMSLSVREVEKTMALMSTRFIETANPVCNVTQKSPSFAKMPQARGAAAMRNRTYVKAAAGKQKSSTQKKA